MRIFELKEEHIKLLSNAIIRWQDCEYGAPEISPKRPYGNSYVEGDIANILWKTNDDYELTEEQNEYCRKVHEETLIALQIILSCKTFTPGVYYKADEYDSTSWKPKDSMIDL